MKKTLIGLLALTLLLSCSKESKTDSSSILGEWTLTEMLMDPGDGSGVFNPVSNGKNLRFFANGFVSSNGDICSLSADADGSTSAQYSMSDSTINASCFDLNFDLNGDELILHFPCIEPCSAKYSR